MKKVTGGSQYKRYGKTHYERNKKSYQERRRIIKKRNKDFINNIKKHDACTDCAAFDPRVLEFDHLPGRGKVMEVSLMVDRGWSIENIKKEIDKCEIVCANCHRIRTLERLASIV